VEALGYAEGVAEGLLSLWFTHCSGAGMRSMALTVPGIIPGYRASKLPSCVLGNLMARCVGGASGGGGGYW